MARSDNLRADIARIGSMPDEEFAAEWGAWCRTQDRDLNLMRERWLDDLRFALPFAEREEAAVEELVAAKAAYAEDPSDENRERKAAAVEAVQAVRAEERANRKHIGIAGDAFTGVK